MLTASPIHSGYNYLAISSTPDFMALLDDGRILAVEYKGGHLMEASKDKLAIGNIWAEASGGHCLFAMPTDQDFSVIDTEIGKSNSVTDKISPNPKQPLT